MKAVTMESYWRFSGKYIWEHCYYVLHRFCGVPVRVICPDSALPVRRAVIAAERRRAAAQLHGARLLDFKNWTQSQSCEVRRRAARQ